MNRASVIAIAAFLLTPSASAIAGTGVPPACEGGPYTKECLDFDVAAQLGLVRHRLETDREVGSGAPIAHRSEAQKAEILRLETIFWKVQRENDDLKRQLKLCRRH